jgi:hypothetical protein
MQYEAIKNCHMEITILRKDFILGVIGSFLCFHPTHFDIDILEN